jgi:uncharacterized protein
MQSCLYECHIMHARFSPRAHRFVHRLFFFSLDLDELEAQHDRLRLFSVDRRNLYSFRQEDFLPVQEPVHRPGASNPGAGALPQTAADLSLKARVQHFLASHGIESGGCRVQLVTLPRVAGYLFNPVSFYFCFKRDGAPLATIAEVTNTFKERKPYLLGPSCLEAAPRSASLNATASGVPTFRLRTPKFFYVSPFSDVDVSFDFTLRAPGEKIALQIDDYTGATRTLTSTVAGVRRELSDTRLAWFTLKYPLVTLKVIALIHWHALRLYTKKTPWFGKAARPADQRDLYRPHLTVATSSEAPR